MPTLEPTMARFCTQQLTRNAFRILGLSADATQSQIDSAARLMRLWNDPAHIPSTPNDAHWLGYLPRTSRDIEDAASRLAEPESRIQERIWWFFAPAVDLLHSRQSAMATIEQIHAAALIRFYRLLRLGDISGVLGKWQHLLESFSHLAQSPEFRSLLVRVENSGDFEKRAEAHEIAAAQGEMPECVAKVLVEVADEAFYNSDLSVISKILEAFQSLNCCENPRRLLVEMLEGHIANSCNQAQDDIQRVWKRAQIDPLKEATQKAITHIDKFCEPLLLQLLLQMPPANVHDRDRLKGPLIQLLNYCSKVYDACHEYLLAEFILEKASVLARGTPMLAMLNNRLDSIRPKAAKRKPLQGVSIIPRKCKPP